MTAVAHESRFISYREHGGPEVMRLSTEPVPEPGDGSVRVRFAAGGLNPVDYKIRSGLSRMAMPLPVRVGREFAGVVDAIGDGVTQVLVGDRVFGSIPQGAFADFVIAPADAVARVPAGVALTTAAGLALAGQTAWDALDSQDLHDGDVIVVSAAAGGVGSLLSQLAVARGVRVIGTASDANHAWLRSRGIVPVVYGDGLAQRLSDAAPDGITAVFDLAGAETITTALALGVPADRINTNATDPAAFGVRGVGRGAVHPPTLDALASLVADATIELPIEASYPFSEVRAAFEHLERGHLRGKVVLVAGPATPWPVSAR